MARIRTIKPGFWKHEDLSDLPEATHMLAAALLNYSDDDGYFNANVGLVKAECCPLREPSVSIHDSLKHLSRVGFIRLGTGQDGKRYGCVVNFAEHQRVNRPIPSKIKDIQIQWDDAVNTHTQLTEPSLLEREEEGNRKGRGKGRESASCDLTTTDPAPPATTTSKVMVHTYNQIAEKIGIPQCQKITPARAKSLARITPGEWSASIRKLEQSAFCRGENDKAWTADIDFLLQPKTRQRLLEGKYDDRKPNGAHHAKSPQRQARDNQFGGLAEAVERRAPGPTAGETLAALPKPGPDEGGGH